MDNSPFQHLSCEKQNSISTKLPERDLH